MNYIDNAKNDLTCQNICDILGKCRESGVSEFTFRDLHVVFESKLHIEKDLSYHSSGPEDGISGIDTKQLVAQDELNYRDEQLATLQLTDPLLYEELIAQKELIVP